ncbi:hypothetical protein GINT2_001377 [Glugoides intestinalis]
MKSFASAYVNLLKTSIGSGVLSFPFLFKTYGIIITILLTFIIGFLATIGLFLLTLCSQPIGRHADLSNLASQSFAFTRIFIDFVVFLKCFGVSLSYVIITGQILPSILLNFVDPNSILAIPWVSLLIFMLLISPFVYFSKIESLKYTSFVGVASIILVIIAAAIRYINTEITHGELALISPITLMWFTGLGKFIFSFTCHQNIFAVNAELDDNSVPNMKKLICAVSVSSFTLYISFGLINYMLYGEDVSDNVLNSYPLDRLGIFVRILYVIVMGVSYPLQLAPARIYFFNMTGITPKMKNYKTIYFTITTLLIMSTYFIAISGVHLGVVYSIVGATASCFMCLILPAIFYIHLNIEKTYFLTIAAYISFMFGVFIFITTIFTMLYININK